MVQYLLMENGKEDLTKKLMNIVGFIKSLRIRWLGHIQRTSEERMPKMIPNAKTDSGGRSGRPRKRWIDGLQG